MFKSDGVFLLLKMVLHLGNSLSSYKLMHIVLIFIVELFLITKQLGDLIYYVVITY